MGKKGGGKFISLSFTGYCPLQYLHIGESSRWNRKFEFDEGGAPTREEFLNFWGTAGACKLQLVGFISEKLPYQNDHFFFLLYI